jgi:hypothetical protein
MTSKSKQKGSNFERDCAKFLSDLYSASFHRNLNGSGAYIGGRNVFRKGTLSESQIRNSKGDITPPEDFDLLNIECKSYASFEFDHLYTDSKLLDTWLSQLMTVADGEDLNILMFKITRRGRFIAVESKHNWELGNHTVYNSKLLGNWIITDFDHFFKLNSEKVKTLSKKENGIGI